MPVREGVSSFSQSTIYQSGSAYRPLVSSLYACPETRIVLESVHCMSVWVGILSLSHSTIRPWIQSTIYLSGRTYHPSVNSLYVCPRGRIVLEPVHYMSAREHVPSLSHSTHCMPVPVRVPSLNQSTVCLSERAYHPRVSSLYACPVARTTLESAQYMPLLKHV